MGRNANKGVDVSIGVVAGQLPVVYPEDAVGAKPFLQPLFYLLPGQWLVAMGGHQTTGSGKDRSLAIALDRTALEDEVQMVFIMTMNHALVVEVLVDLVVELSLEFLAPTVKLEVEKAEG